MFKFPPDSNCLIFEGRKRMLSNAMKNTYSYMMIECSCQSFIQCFSFNCLSFIVLRKFSAFSCHLFSMGINLKNDINLKKAYLYIIFINIILNYNNSKGADLNSKLQSYDWNKWFLTMHSLIYLNIHLKILDLLE
jgi:hypothetical protein